MEQKLHTPEGVRDIYHEECKRKMAVSKKLQKVLHLYGYQDIQTPSFEYFDVFRKEIGTISTRELYKFFDREGNTLVLRPDFTPSIARAAATLFEEEEFPLRLCYSGSTFINHSSYKGHLKENTQMGAEFIGDDSPEADAEMIAMVIEGLRAVGLGEFQVNIGHVDFIRSLMEATGLTDEKLEALHTLIANRNYFGVEEILSNEQVAEEVCLSFRILPELIGGAETLEHAMQAAEGTLARQALARLQRIYEILSLYGVQKYVTFDLSMSGTYGYYSGIVFRAYTYGTGDAIVRGGRYNHLLEKFGKSTPSIGFGILVDDLLNALSRQKIKVDISRTNLLVYNESTQRRAISLANEFRQSGKYVELFLRKNGESKESYIEYGRRTQALSMLYLEDMEHMVMIDLRTGREERINTGK